MKNAQRLAFATCLATVLLIGLGAFVRATGSGLGCPDWPTCHGGAIPPGSKTAVIEYSHRFVGSVVGLMVIGTALLAWRHYRHVPFITWLALATVPLVGFQGILGAITVYRELPPEIVATHLLMAMLVLTCEAAVAIAMYFDDADHRARVVAVAKGPGRRIGGLALLAVAWLAVTLWIGGYMAESGASTACSGWPTCNGSVVPANDHQEIVHMAHRYLAGAFLLLLLPVVLVAWRERERVFWAGPLAISLAVLYTAQVLVGALNVWYTFPDWLTVAHTVVAACVWLALAAASILAFYAPAAERRVSGRLTTRAEVPA